MKTKTADRRNILHEDLKAIAALYAHYITDATEPSPGWLNKIRSFCRKEGLGPPFLLGFVATHATGNPRGYLSAILRKKCGAPQREEHADSWEAWIASPCTIRSAKEPSSLGRIIKELGL